jgi:NAD(P)-dependent dehydrogenase (short-subunit alcohol dehydrogenase family)
MRLKDKSRRITGAGTGLGRAIAIMFARGREGDLNGRRAAAREGRGGDRAGWAARRSRAETQPRRPTSRRLVEATVKTFGRLDIPVNNAGGIPSAAVLA